VAKTDFKRTMVALYAPSSKAFSIVDVPPMQFLMIDGHGDPNTAPAYQEAVEALYAVAYKVKFISKRKLGRDYVVAPLEGLWWAQDTDAFSARDKGAWDWTMMIMQPEWITSEIVRDAQAQAGKGKDLPGLPRLRLETYHEGLSVQILHIGSYDAEGPTIVRMHSEFMPANRLIPAGKHHEIYLSDPRRVTPGKLKTILRQPVRKVG
jgi:hypothetical protein